MASQPQRVALFGGTFDPVHHGHLEVAGAARNALDLDRVHFLPCRQSPHKQDQRSTASSHRLTMLRYACEGLDWAVVDPFELHRPLPSYSYLTAAAFAEAHPDAELYWIMGGDQWQALERWAQWQDLAAQVNFIVFQRGGTLEARPGVRAHFISGGIDISATAIRQGRAHSGIPSVDRYGRENGLW